MRNFTLKMFIMACIVFVAGFANGQAKPENYPTIGQSFVKDAETASGIFTIDFNTTEKTSTWTQVNDTTVEFSWGKARTGKGIAVTVWEADSANAAKLNPNEDFKVRSGRFRNNENPNHVASVDSLQALLAKWEEVYAGTADSAKNTLNNYSACVFDVNGDPANQAYGVHPGIYKKLEYEFVFRWAGQILTSDFEFDMFTYDEGNTGATATYYLRVDFGSIDTTVQNVYVTGSELKHIKLAELTGLNISDFSNQSEVHIFIGTDGTGTEIAEGVYDPVVVFDNMTVTFAAPVWVDPAGGLDGGTFGNADAPFKGSIGEDKMVSIPLKMMGRVAPMTITDKLWKNNSGDKVNKVLTFPDTLGIMANDGEGNYTVEVPYSIQPAAWDMGTQSWSEQKITVAAPETAQDLDWMFSFKVKPEAENYFTNIEIESTVRVTYQVHVEGTGSTIIDLTDVEDGYALEDTLSGVPDSAQIILAPGKNYSLNKHSLDKSVVISSSDLSAEELPYIYITGNFDMVENASLGYFVLRNLKMKAEAFDGDYIMNQSKQSTIQDFVVESCEISNMRGILRVKANQSGVENFTVKDCVVDSLENYGVYTVDQTDSYINNIVIKNSTFTRCKTFITSKNNSNSLSIVNCTFFEAPAAGNYLIRYRTDGSDNIWSGLTINKGVFGHGWDMSGGESYGIKGMDGLAATEIKVSSTIKTNDFSFSSDTIPALADADVYNGSSYEMWVDPANGNLNWVSEAYAGFGLGDPRWVYEDTTVYLLYAGAGDPATMEPSDSLLVDYLTKAGYNVKYVSHNDIGVAGYDYSSYEALIVGESTSSSKIVPFGKDDNYPIPLVSLEGFGVKSDKWGWLTSNDNFQESRTAVENMEMKILDNSHYITQDLEVDQVVSLSTADPSSSIYAWGLGIGTDVPGAIALGQNTNAEITEPMLWAVPINTMLGASGQVNSNRLVIFAANAKGLDEATDDFNMLVERSLEWVLGAGSTTSAPVVKAESDVLVYPNPTRDNAKVRFTVDNTQEVSLSLFNMLGQKLQISSPQVYPSGTHEIDIRSRDLNEGLYIYVLQVGKDVHKGKLNVIK